MSVKNKLFLVFLLAFTVLTTMCACAGMVSMRGQNVRIYHESVNKMVEISRQAVFGGFHLQELLPGLFGFISNDLIQGDEIILDVSQINTKKLICSRGF